jgi:RNA polymerase sigma-70 factor (ECF subfamily)
MIWINSGSSAEDRLVRADEKKRLEAAIARLAPRQRMALVLRDMEELPTEEVARILGLSRITVRVHIRAARLRLRELLQTAEGGVHELPTS